MDRQYISDILLELETQEYRRKFLIRLKECRIGEEGIKVYGEWKDGKYPIMDDYYNDRLLAELAEEWLGL